jgi:hypothetical protein
MNDDDDDHPFFCRESGRNSSHGRHTATTILQLYNKTKIIKNHVTTDQRIQSD